MFPGSDNLVIVWDVGTGEALCSVDLPDIPLCASWNWDGSRVVVSCKDKKIRILDPREESVVKVRERMRVCARDERMSYVASVLASAGVRGARRREAHAGRLPEGRKYFHDGFLAHERATTRLVGQGKHPHLPACV